MAVSARLGDSGRFPIKITGSRADDSAYWISVSHGVIQPLDVERIDCLSSSIAVDVSVKGSTGPIRTQDSLLGQGLCNFYESAASRMATVSI